MHKHILCAHSSPQPVCSTSTQGHKDLALGEHYQPCNKVQGTPTAAGDRAKPSPRNTDSMVICLAQRFVLLQTWSSPYRRGERLREQEAKWLVWFMGCGPEKQIALAHELTAQTLEHSSGTEWEKVCYLYSQ